MLLVLAGALAALVQYMLPPAEQAAPDAPAPIVEPEPVHPAVRKIPPAPPVEAGAAPVIIPAPAVPTVSPAPRPAEPAPAQVEPEPSEAVAIPAPPPAAAPRGEAEVATAEKTEGPAAIALVDLNTASVAELNHLHGGGNIGRAIVAKRPYAQVGDLLTKRVLSRAVYERIREQVTVR